jgi:Na+/H+ antiporter NhaD/arsenite permease-like protein
MEFAPKWQVITAAVIFVVCYGFIISEKINRAIIAAVGAMLLIVIGIVDFKVAYTSHIHWETILLLLGMMIIVAITNRSGLFQYLAILAAQRAKGEPVKIMVSLLLLTAIGGAFVDNVTIVLLVVPITLAIARTLNISPMPYLITQIIFCNIGGTATLVGDPPNIMIGAAAGISFNAFLIHITPFIVCTMIILIPIMKYIYRNSFTVTEESKQKLMEINAEDFIRDRSLVKKSVLAFSLTLIGFFVHGYFNMEPAVVAMSGAAFLMLIGIKEESEIHEMFANVEWTTLFFFGGLFCLVGGLIDVGIIAAIALWMIEVTGGNVAATALMMLWGAAVSSAFLDNIPLVATMIPIVHDMIAALNLDSTDAHTLWWSLALGACLGGNATLVASSPNLVVAALAAKDGTPISFIEYLKIGVPITIFTLVLATFYVYFVYVVLGFSIYPPVR